MHLKGPHNIFGDIWKGHKEILKLNVFVILDCKYVFFLIAVVLDRIF